MKIHEFQAKKILKKYGVPIPRGEVAKTPAKAQKVAEKLGGKVVVKAQIHAGGRGKLETAQYRLSGSLLCAYA